MRTKILYSIIALLFLIFGASSWLIYRWQQHQVENLQSNLSTANKRAATSNTALLNEIKSNSKASIDLQKKYQAALDTIKTTTAPTITTTHQATQEDLD